MPSVLIALPMMRGQLEPECFHSLMAARRHLYATEIKHHVSSTACSLITEARNSITADYLNHMDMDYLMWVDSDMKFPPWGINRLLSRGLDIVGGVYYRKEAEARPLIFQYTETGELTTKLEFPKDRCFEVDGIGTGFLLIKRHVLEKFLPDVAKEYGHPFALGVNPVGKEEGEDLSFCRRIKKLGFKVWADPTIPLGHIGTCSYDREKFDMANGFKEWRKAKDTYDNDIDGWMTRGELNWLHRQAAQMGSIIEVGSWKGRSTHALLSACKGKVIAIDTWKGSENEVAGPHKEATEHDILADCFLPNVGQFPNLEVWKMDSLTAAKRVPDKSVDMVFIDGDHRYEAVKADIEAWLPKARKLICGHDYYTHSVQEAVTETFGEPDLAESIWVKRLDGEIGA